MTVKIHDLSKKRLMTALETCFSTSAEVLGLHHSSPFHQALVVTTEGVALIKTGAFGYSIDDLIRAGELTGAAARQEEDSWGAVVTEVVATSTTSRLRYVLGIDSPPTEPSSYGIPPPYPNSGALFKLNSREVAHLCEAIERCMRETSTGSRITNRKVAEHTARTRMETTDFAILAPLGVGDPRSGLGAGLYPQYPRLNSLGEVQIHPGESTLLHFGSKRLTIDETWNRERQPAGRIINTEESTAQVTLTSERLIIDVPTFKKISWRGKPFAGRHPGGTSTRFLGHIPLECLMRVESATLPIGAAVVCTTIALTDRYSAEFSVDIPVPKRNSLQTLQLFAGAIRERWSVFVLPPNADTAVREMSVDGSELGRLERLAGATHSKVVCPAVRPIGSETATGQGFEDRGEGDLHPLMLVPPADRGGAAGWYTDLTRLNEYRYWNGQRWTGNVANGGQSQTDGVFEPSVDS